MSNRENLVEILRGYVASEQDKKASEEQDRARMKFIARFPADQLENLGLKDYCIGTGVQDGFCWWVERGTDNLSKYSPGSSKSYGVYWSKDSKEYHFSAAARGLHIAHPKLDPETVLRQSVVEPIARFVHSCGRDWDSAAKAVGRGFLLKLLILYYPDQFIQINSLRWIDRIIDGFGLERKPSFVENNQTVKRFYDEYKTLPSGDEISQGAFVSILVDMLGLKKSRPGEQPSNVRFWHMQLHPTNNKRLQREDVIRLLSEYRVVGMGSGWENDGGQPKQFRDDVAIGDVIGIRENGFVALVRVVGPCQENKKVDELCWFDIVREVELLSTDAEEYMERYRAETGKGPHDNIYAPSTLSQVKPQCKNKFLKFWYESLVGVDQVDEAEELACDGLDAGHEPYGRDAFLGEVFMHPTEYARVTSVLERKRNVVLSGAPGVGKTFAARRLAWAMMGEKDDSRIQFVQFHQSYSYEDFVCGYKPTATGFELRNGVFYDFCKRAASDPSRKYFFIIDEINRGNLSKIFGELLVLIEADKRGRSEYSVRLAYRPDESFVVPANVYIVGMMNTADRSLAMLDYALRRRFGFVSIKPGFAAPAFKALIRDGSKMAKLVDAVVTLNDSIAADPSLGEGYEIGHSYFCDPQALPEEVVEYDLIPLISEYWFDDRERFCREAEALRASVR